MRQRLISVIESVLKELGISDVIPQVEISESPDHGEYTTNVAMRLAKTLKNLPAGRQGSPMDIALQVVEALKGKKIGVKASKPIQNTKQRYQKRSPQIPAKDVLQDIDRIEIAPPGFINMFLTEAKLSGQLSQVLKQENAYGTAQKKSAGIKMVEFAHPNTHKAFHIGHLRNISTGESIVRLLESQGTKVIRVNYQGDVGMHIAKALYALLQISELRTQIPKVRTQDLNKKVEFLGKAYTAGNKVFEENEDAKKEIGEINKKIYAKDPSIFSLYKETRQWSLDYFEMVYRRVGTRYDRYYFEREVYESGKKYVLKALKKGIFVGSEGAIIFPGEKFGLHNRVFITGEGNATYEGKDVGLVRLQLDEYHPDLIIHVVGPEQAGYFQVLFKALEQVFPDSKGKEYHLIYGWVRLKHGKMSSRSGNVVLGEWLLDEASKEINNILAKNKSNYPQIEQNDIAEKGAVAAVKYAFLKVSTKQDIAFDLQESVSFDGDSGPYLQYAYARCRSVLRKASGRPSDIQSQALKSLKSGIRLNPEEHAVARLIHFFPEIVAVAAEEFAPNVLCKYLFDLAQAFNLFYQKHEILGNDFRLALTAATAQVLHNGLNLLGIQTVERM